MDEKLFEVAVSHLSKWLVPDERAMAYLIHERNMFYQNNLNEKDKTIWFIKHHLRLGMAVRNVLREVVPDDSVGGNWDDQYISVLNKVIDDYVSIKEKSNDIVFIQSDNVYCKNEYHSVMTDDMNEHLNQVWKDAVLDKYILGSYVMNNKTDNAYCIRFPGATRGYILVDENDIILEVVFYPDTCFSDGIGCYEKSIIEAINKKYVGKHISFSEGGK